MKDIKQRLHEIVSSKTAGDPKERIAQVVESRNARIKTASETGDVKSRLREIVASKTANDPRDRIAQSVESRNARIKTGMAVKQAGLGGDITGDVIASMLPFGMGAPISAGGTVHGFVTDDTGVPNDAAGVVPGIGNSRIIRRLRKVRKDVAPEAKSQRSRIMSDVIAPMTFPLAAGATGALAGALAGAHRYHHTTGDAADGALVGGLTGLAAGTAANLAAALAAAITNRRTRDEQRAAELEPGLLSHVVPGKGVYNYWKRLGYSKNYDEDAVKARKVVDPDIEKARKLLEEMRNKG